MSRDDSGKFLPFSTTELEIVKANPFATIDQAASASLMKQMAVEGGRTTRPEIKLGICGDRRPTSIAFFTAANPLRSNSATSIGLAYVSCSPYRVPVRGQPARHHLRPVPAPDVPARRPRGARVGLRWPRH
jgi:pyruvate,orthophosphate dikinase